MNDEQKFILKNWYLKTGKDGSLIVAKGNVFNNAKFKEGRFIKTSSIETIELNENIVEIKTRNSVYYCDVYDINNTSFETKTILCEMFPSDEDVFEKIFDGIVENYPFKGEDYINIIYSDLDYLKKSDFKKSSYVFCVNLLNELFFAGIFYIDENGEVARVLYKPVVIGGMFCDYVLCHNDFISNGEEKYFEITYFFEVNMIDIAKNCCSFAKYHPLYIMNVSDVPITVSSKRLDAFEYFMFED